MRARAAIFDRYGRDVQRVLARVLGVDSEMPDMLQEVFVRALDGLDRVQDPDRLRPWLLSIAVYVARECIRRRTRWRWLPFSRAQRRKELVVEAAAPEIREALRAASVIIERLECDDRIAFGLRFVGGMELTEVAEACGVSLATIKRRLFRARAQFESLARAQPALRDWMDEGASWTKE